tara:strand:- start:40 stop:582 length:543 start_codon:yes stop_codon:yes gene_type:complete
MLLDTRRQSSFVERRWNPTVFGIDRVWEDGRPCEQHRVGRDYPVRSKRDFSTRHLRAFRVLHNRIEPSSVLGRSKLERRYTETLKPDIISNHQFGYHSFGRYLDPEYREDVSAKPTQIVSEGLMLGYEVHEHETLVDHDSPIDTFLGCSKCFNILEDSDRTSGACDGYASGSIGYKVFCS